MRLIVVPLSVKTSMVYCQKLALPAARQTPRIDDKLVARAAKTWGEWQKSDSKLKKTIISWANIALERISYEEWSLKTIPAQSSIKRKVVEANSKVNESDPHHVTHAEFEKHELENSDLESIPVIFPSSILDRHQVTSRLQALASRGINHHTKYMWMSAIGAPLTLPVALLPVIPNLPGFYLLFRAWSNWKAVEGGKHLNYLLKNDHLSYHDDARLSQLFTQLKNHSENVAETENPDKETAQSVANDSDQLLLDEEHINELVNILGAKEMAPELHRAVRQIKKKFQSDIKN
ncbi:hypothetical protein AWJ20_3343 [Sugiyamaella lignohabitans]|uniref:Uncharacterized protein n=1 Tax=Sugiyamaella lignohabitans TaxID=796027 RepID=A0A167FU25_9ASCO|nr:uncharacterized protein AWJ20_3343 [Sugiyamaella lignohabitans]ANB15704.1 hypothetical protein AWJ20_3343 [Sugiyamaella lignohabitans]